MSRYPESAEDWVVRLLDTEASAADLEALETWCRADPQNRREFDLLRRAWRVSGRLEHDAALRPPTVARADRTRGRRRIALGAALAAGLVAAVVVWLMRPADGDATRYRTAKGERRTVALEDGTEIVLNTDTVLDVTAGETRVGLLDGEAFFDVEPRSAQPFSVRAGRVEIAVLGTRFNVLNEDDSQVISVAEGRVSVALRGADREPFLLGAGDTLEIDGPSGDARKVVGSPHLARIEAWRAGKVEFDRATLADAAKELSRYTAQPIVIGDDSMRDLRVSGVFRIDLLGQLDSLVFAIETSLPVDARITPSGLRLESLPVPAIDGAR